jgi:mannitol-1-phosphate/altronate dehydrogenase
LQVLHLPLAQARFVHYYQKENPGSEVSLQADDEVQAMKDMIKQAGTKALQKFLSRLVAEVEGQNRNDSSGVAP